MTRQSQRLAAVADGLVTWATSASAWMADHVATSPAVGGGFDETRDVFVIVVDRQNLEAFIRQQALAIDAARLLALALGETGERQ